MIRELINSLGFLFVELLFLYINILAKNLWELIFLLYYFVKVMYKKEKYIV